MTGYGNGRQRLWIEHAREMSPEGKAALLAFNDPLGQRNPAFPHWIKVDPPMLQYLKRRRFIERRAVHLGQKRWLITRRGELARAYLLEQANVN